MLSINCQCNTTVKVFWFSFLLFHLFVMWSVINHSEKYKLKSRWKEGQVVNIMEFCPTCGVLLQIEPASSGRRMRFFCAICPYVCAIEGKVSWQIPCHHLSSKSHWISLFIILILLFFGIQIVKKEILKKKDIDPIITSEESNKSRQKGEGNFFFPDNICSSVGYCNLNSMCLWAHSDFFFSRLYFIIHLRQLD